MKALRYGISLVLVAGFAMTASCGGSTDGGDDSAAGGAAPGSAGRAANAGAPSQGGRNSGLAGAMNNPGCPAAAPADASACTLTGNQTTCSYTGMSCSCARTGGGGGMLPGGAAGGAASNREWQCRAVLVCPAAKPADGGACTPASGNCNYAGMGTCSCSTQTSKWSCRGGTTGGGGAGSGFAGTPGFAGSLNGGSGFPGFPGFAGAINGGGGTGSGIAGAAAGTNCPATKPTADTACTGTDACPYTGGGCVCQSDKWSCL